MTYFHSFFFLNYKQLHLKNFAHPANISHSPLLIGEGHCFLKHLNKSFRKKLRLKVNLSQTSETSRHRFFSYNIRSDKLKYVVTIKKSFGEKKQEMILSSLSLWHGWVSAQEFIHFDGNLRCAGPLFPEPLSE